MNEIASLNNKTISNCTCERGYDGAHCELLEDMCVNITCQNKGVCISTYLSWSCRCLAAYFYGNYCEYQSTEFVVKQVLSKSFASVAITAIIAVFLFVIIMDILKLVFQIDPVDRERQIMESERRKRRLNKKEKKKPRKTALKLFYIP
jgi:hypothetical protein